MMLNALAGFSVENTERYLLTANQAFADYFIRQWDKFDAMEKPIAPSLKLPPALKALYKKNGYLPIWDSVYQKRIPLLKKYCDGVLKLVQDELSYLKANQSMYQSKEEAIRMQYVEAEVKVLQKLVYLNNKLKQVLLTDGAEKVQFCKDHPSNCNKEAWN